LTTDRYKGVVVRTIIGRIPADDVETDCRNELDSKEDAIKDAKEPASR
jgi:hypothetical protein